MQSYNPFNKGINELKTEDLAALRSVCEGWYIEYKQEISKADAIAKSISALANTYGGWLFYGIKEMSKENSVAGEFLGIDNIDVDGALQRIRQAVASMVSPDCRYEVKALYGPCDDLQLPDDKAIICVAVPQSIEAPHIHKKGLIYRRIADGSEPVAENDRHIINKMLDRSEQIKSEYREWLEEDPELSKGESGHPHIRLMITTNPWRAPRTNFLLSLDSARDALGANSDSFRTIPFDTFYTSSRGVIARQCLNRDPISSTLTWHIYRSLSSDVSIPLNVISGSTESLSTLLHNHNTGRRFSASLGNSKIEWAKLVDLNILFHVIMGVIESHRALLQKAEWPCEFGVKIKIINAWRTVPYLDTEFFLEHVEKNGIPVCLTENCTNPPGSDPDTFIQIKESTSGDSEQVKVAVQTFRVFIPIAEAFGIPLSDLLLKEFSEDNRVGSPIYDSLITAGKHAASLSKKNQH
ncbi:ATP-binding protein [uncultured Pseudomonas sp.]|uniref:AlbA family DNA-binding domain-containing protein n=1 Tax=uncultured Pseudomonas sp. TaxID=114707 RepID=UPI0025FD8129|nr:ATP-binding protein [uncultured Pseudomonas sp.]